MRFVLLLLLLVNVIAIASESADSFIVTIFNDHVKVVGPKESSTDISVIIHNRTLSDVRGKIIALPHEKKLAMINVKANDQEVAPIRVPIGSQIFYVPQAPAFQKVELSFGRKAYQVPPKRD